MGYIVFAVIMLVLMTILWIGMRKMSMVEKDQEKLGATSKQMHGSRIRLKWLTISNGMAIALVLMFIVFLISTLNNSIKTVNAGKAGIVYTFGKITGQINEGFNLILPWQDTEIANVQIQSYHFKKLSCFSNKSQNVYIDAVLNLNISETAIQRLYREVGKDYFAKLIAPRVAQNFKDETVKYDAVEIAPNRERIREVVTKRLQKELSQWSVDVKDLLLDNISFEDAFQKNIEAKQNATQKALEEAENVKVKKAEADQAIEEARGIGESILVKATKQAEANRKLNESLSQNLIQYTMITKLSDKINVMMVPTGSNMILGQDMFKPTKEEKK